MVAKIECGEHGFALLWLQREALAGRDVVIEGNFDCVRDTQRFLRAVQQTPTQWVQVLVVCDGEVLLARHRARGLSGKRHPGHHEGALLEELHTTLLEGRISPLNLPGACLTVDTTDYLLVNPNHVVQQLWSLLDS